MQQHPITNTNIKMRIVPFILLLFLLGLSVNTQAQTKVKTKTMALDLENALQLAGANNLTIKAYQLKHEEAIAQHKSAKEWWYPTIQAGIRLHQLNGAVMNGDGRFFTNVDRQNVWGGIGANLELDLGNGIFSAAAAKQKIAATQMATKAAKNETILAVVHQYYDLQSEQMKNFALQQLKEQSEEMAAQLEVQVDVGLGYKSDWLLAKSNISHQHIAIKKSEGELYAKSAKLAQLLNMKDGVQLFIADTALVPVELVDESKIDAMVIGNHPAYKSTQLQLDVVKAERNVIGKGLLLPTLSLGVSNAIFGDIFSPTDIEFQTMDPLYNTFQINGSIMWRLPLNNLFGAGDRRLYDAKMTLYENQLQQIQTQLGSEINAAYAQLIAAREQIEIAKEGMAFAKEAIEQSIERQKMRTAQAFEVFQAQEYFIRSQMDYFDAVNQYNKAQYSLYLAMGNDL